MLGEEVGGGRDVGSSGTTPHRSLNESSMAYNKNSAEISGSKNLSYECLNEEQKEDYENQANNLLSQSMNGELKANKLPWQKGKTRFVNIGQDVDEARP